MSGAKPKLGIGRSVPGWRAWAGLVVGPVAWGIHHQLGSDVSYAACDRGPDVIALAVGLVLLIAIGAAGWTSWRSWKTAGGMQAKEADALEVFIPLLSVMGATLFALTIFVQLLADIIIPSCFG
jgi:TRAP-type C4-dicarboxylate transport system permease small subunit